MIRLIRAELLKLRTTQVWFWLLLAAVAIAAVFVIGPFAAGGVNSVNDLVDVFHGASIAYIVVFVLGALGVTTEFRYQTITPTVLATPSRWSLVTAKMITYALVGAGYAAICLAVQVAIAAPWLSARHAAYGIGTAPVPRTLGAVFLVVTLFGVVGMGVGALLRNQIVAVAVGVIFLLVLQGILSVIPKVRVVYPYLPGGGMSAILSTGRANDMAPPGVHLLSAAGGIVVLLLWAFVPAVLGASITMNRDIT